MWLSRLSSNDFQSRIGDWIHSRLWYCHAVWVCFHTLCCSCPKMWMKGVELIFGIWKNMLRKHWLAPSLQQAFGVGYCLGQNTKPLLCLGATGACGGSMISSHLDAKGQICSREPLASCHYQLPCSAMWMWITLRGTWVEMLKAGHQICW